MTTAKMSMKDRAAGLGKPKTEAVAEPATEAPAAPVKAANRKAAARTEDISLSVGVSPRIYHKLVAYTNELAMSLGVSRVPHVRVIRALLEELESDKDLQEKIASRVIKQYE